MSTPGQPIAQPIIDWGRGVVGIPLHWLNNLDQNQPISHLARLLTTQGPPLPGPLQHPVMAAQQEMGRITPEAAARIRQLVSTITGGK